MVEHLQRYGNLAIFKMVNRDFCDFQDGGRRHLGFSQIRNLTGLSAVRGQDASP